MLNLIQAQILQKAIEMPKPALVFVAAYLSHERVTAGSILIPTPGEEPTPCNFLMYTFFKFLLTICCRENCDKLANL